MLRETFHNSHALLAFFALSNADVIIARTTLDERQAGLYAGGLILTKAVLFLPQFVVVIAFPSMSRAGPTGVRTWSASARCSASGWSRSLGVTVLSDARRGLRGRAGVRRAAGPAVALRRARHAARR